MQETSIGDYNMEREDEYYYNQLYNKKANKSMAACFYSLVGVLLLLILSLLLSSCKSIQYVPVESHSIEHHYHNDTIKEKDSVFSEKTTVIKEADSALVASLGLKLKSNEKAILILKNELQRLVSEKEKSKSDTVIKVDSIKVPYPVERKLTKWEQTKMDAGGIAIGVCIAFVIIIIVVFLIRAHKKT